MPATYSIYTYSVIAILGICSIIFLLLIFQRRREQEKKRKQIELLTARSQLESMRDQLNRLRKNFYDVENRYNDDRHYAKVKKEELVQLAKKLKVIEEERDDVKKTIEEGTADVKAINLLENRLGLVQENIDKLSGEAQVLQDDVKRLEQSVIENEKKYKSLTNQISQAEQELERQKEMVKIKETRAKA